jgi:hypothetical protein
VFHALTFVEEAATVKLAEVGQRSEFDYKRSSECCLLVTVSGGINESSFESGVRNDWSVSLRLYSSARRVSILWRVERLFGS